MLVNKNDIYEITINDIGNDGEGIGHIPEDVADSFVTSKGENRGVAVFVKDTVIGDVIKVKIIKVKKNYAYGRLMEIVTPSPYRIEAVCANARRCGGCSIMHMMYEKQLEYKFNKVKNCLERIGGLTGIESLMEPIYGMDNPYNYRNKMQFPVGLDRDKKVQIGFYAGRTHSIIDLSKCDIGHPVNEYLVKYIRIWLQDNNDKTGHFIYNEETGRGLVRHILTRVGFVTGELMICVVINGNNLDKPVCEELNKTLENAVHEYNEVDKTGKKIKLTSVSININKEKTNKILGKKCVTLYGQDYISDYIGDVKFNISPLSFYQVNPLQTKVLYDKAVEYADLSGNETVWDMYCGIGTISLCLAQKAKKVYGVEIVPQAIEDAKENARLNNIENTQFYCGKAEEVVPQFYGDANQNGEGKHPDVVVVDPPRKGCDAVLLDTIDLMSPNRLVYVSCDPATLARDVKILVEKGFEVKKIAVVDQFSHSSHVETCVLLAKTNVREV